MKKSRMRWKGKKKSGEEWVFKRIIYNIMEGNTINTLLLRTAFCCVACDGEIASEEVGLIETICKENSALQEVDF
jgi:hypothetical protein